MFKRTDTGVYTITSPSGKIYVGGCGSKRGFKGRWSVHLADFRHGRHANAMLQAAYNKYGEASMVFTRVVMCNPEDVLDFEQMLMDELNPAYNIRIFADSNLGVPKTPEHKQRLREVYINNPELREVIAEHSRKAWKKPGREVRISKQKMAINTPDVAAKRLEGIAVYRASVKGLNNSKKFGKRTKEDWADPVKRGVRVANMLKTVQSEAHREAQSRTMKAILSAPEIRAKLSAGQKIAMNTPEAKQRQSELSKSRWQSDEFKESTSKKIKEALSTPEQRAKRSASMKARNSQPEVRKELSKNTTNIWSDPVKRAERVEAMRKAAQDPEVRAKRSAGIKAAIAAKRLAKLREPANEQGNS